MPFPPGRGSVEGPVRRGAGRALRLADPPLTPPFQGGEI
ncbi:hypothetical protein C725_2607 [Pacificimonas flava]|uniref:Uncharacterized protein n=1 Tax=Pacificimonas flava TaxID=1234595 RepID=M2TJW6_9SPHN|nr:hypothetical protein C725_2607 [Pacificimonas flava]